METKVGQEREVESGKAGTNMNEYREAVRKLIETEVRNVIDEEMRKAAQELLDEQRKAISQMVEEHRLVAVFRAEPDRGLATFGVIGPVVVILGPEVLLVREHVHDLSRVGVFGERG